LAGTPPLSIRSSRTVAGYAACCLPHIVDRRARRLSDSTDGLGHNYEVDPWTEVGLGLDYGTVGLSRTTEEWLVAGSALRDRVADMMGIAGRVEQIGSSSVLGLLAKPIIDLAVGLTPDDDLALFTAELEAAGWIYRGDAGSAGGHVFVLETRPWHRVAHLHAVELHGEQWSNYLRLRDLLRASPQARDRYETEKVRLADQHTHDHEGYTAGKTHVVTSLLAATDEPPPSPRRRRGRTSDA
jgi:GrpB-like predicted nucleotidyltransferase (UPF0157 family)